MSPLLTQNLAPLAPFLQPNITNLYINRPGEMIIEHTNGTRETKSMPECSGEWIEGIGMILANQHGNAWKANQPLPSCRLPGGHRAQILIGDWVVGRYALAIRVHHQASLSLDDFDWQSPDDKEQIKHAVRARKNLLIAGSTGAGKTSMLSALIRTIPKGTRFVVIEDVEELHLEESNVVHLICSQENEGEEKNRESRALLSAALRLNPDRIIVGEIRQHTASTFFRAIHTGHPGSLATIHAENKEGALNACIDDMILNGDMAESGRGAARKRLEQTIFGVISLTRLENKALARWERC